MTEDPPQSPRFAFPVSEMLIVVAVLSTLWAFLLPAVNAARDVPQRGMPDGQPPLLPQLQPLYEYNPWLFLIDTPIVVTACVALLLGVIRCLIPRKIRKYFPWKTPPKKSLSSPEPIADSRPAIATSAMAFIATATLLFAASHVRSDRTNRSPVVTWEGPIADYVQQVAIFGWVLPAITIIFGIYTLYRFRSKLNFLAVIGTGLAYSNFFGSCIFYCAVYED